MADTRLQNVMRELSGSFQEAFKEDRQDWDRAWREQRVLEGKSEDAPRFDNMVATYPTSVRIRENLGIADKTAAAARREMGMGLETTPTRRAGQMLGTLAQDVVQDKGRSFYWLLNALQATGGVIAEQTIGRAIPQLYKQSPVLDAKGREITVREPISAKGAGLITNTEEPYKTTKGVKIKDETYVKDDYSGGMKAAAMLIPTGLAINSAAGLLTPLGGAEGYKALFPSEEDPNKTDNPVLEVASKYFMGRKGNILPWEEFSQVRPDVSREEYNQYKAYKAGRQIDMNPTDGDINLGGIIKATSEGIHGPEVEMLGQTLPVTTGVVPYASALAGGVVGGRMGAPNKTAAMGALLGGMAGLGGGTVAGNLIESERRRRNSIQNDEDTMDGGYLY